jgi:hypothetical protein
MHKILGYVSTSFFRQLDVTTLTIPFIAFIFSISLWVPPTIKQALANQHRPQQLQCSLDRVLLATAYKNADLRHTSQSHLHFQQLGNCKPAGLPRINGQVTASWPAFSASACEWLQADQPSLHRQPSDCKLASLPRIGAQVTASWPVFSASAAGQLQGGPSSLCQQLGDCEPANLPCIGGRVTASWLVFSALAAGWLQGSLSSLRQQLSDCKLTSLLCIGSWTTARRQQLGDCEPVGLPCISWQCCC